MKENKDEKWRAIQLANFNQLQVKNGFYEVKDHGSEEEPGRGLSRSASDPSLSSSGAFSSWKGSPSDDLSLDSSVIQAQSREAAEVDPREVQQSPRMVGDVDLSKLPSIGSANHHLGSCSPCCFQWRTQCVTGKNCPYCHFDHEPKQLRPGKKSRDRAKRRQRKIADDLQTHSPAEPASPGVLPCTVPATKSTSQSSSNEGDNENDDSAHSGPYAAQTVATPVASQAQAHYQPGTKISL